MTPELPDRPHSTFARHLTEVASGCGDLPAIVQGDRIVRWREFAVESFRLASELRELGIGAGSRVGIYCFNCPEYLIAMYALFAIDAVPVNINYRYQASELAHLLTDCSAEGLIHAAELGSTVDEALPNVPGCTVRVVVDLPAGGLTVPTAPAGTPQGARRLGNGDEWLLYTGGTTGMPKAVIGSQRERLDVLYGLGLSNIGWTGEQSPPASRVLSYQRENGINPVYFAISPLMHGTGLYCALIGLVIGGTVVLTKSRSFDPLEIVQGITDHRVTDMHVVGEAMMLPLADTLDEMAEDGRPHDISSLRRIQSSGAVWTAQTKRRLLEYADAELTDMIAATEGGPFALSRCSRSQPPTDTTAFRLIPGARVIQDDGTDVEPGTNEVGILAVPTSPAAHYLGDPQRTARTFRDLDGQRYVAPGDLAVIEADGSLRLLGRGSSVINTGGEKVYADEVEDILRQHPSVKDVAVVGVPDKRFGSVVGAVVVLTAGMPETSELAAFVGESHSGYKKPRVVVSVPQLQRLPNGKTDLKWAQEQLVKAHEGGGS